VVLVINIFRAGWQVELEEFRRSMQATKNKVPIVAGVMLEYEFLEQDSNDVGQYTYFKVPDGDMFCVYAWQHRNGVDSENYKNVYRAKAELRTVYSRV